MLDSVDLPSHDDDEQSLASRLIRIFDKFGGQDASGVIALHRELECQGNLNEILKRQKPHSVIDTPE